MPERVIDLHAPDPAPSDTLELLAAGALVEQDERERIGG